MRVRTTLTAALLVSLAACQSETDERMEFGKSAPVKVIVSENTQMLKTKLDGYNVKWVYWDDKIGVFSPQASIEDDAPAGVSNAKFVASSTGPVSSFDGKMYWGEGNNDFYAYYPYNANAGTDATAVPISLPSYQVQEGESNAHIGGLDFMVATPVNVVPGKLHWPCDPIYFKFNHVFTMLEFCITTGNGVESADLYQIKITANSNLALSSGTIDITQPTPSGIYSIGNVRGEKSVVLNIKGDCLLTNDPKTTAKAYVMILPGSIKGDVELQITTSKGVSFIKKGEKDFSRGAVYKTNVNLTSYDNMLATDGDANIYKAVAIGNQVWLSENLKSTRLIDGTPLVQTPPRTDATRNTPGYRWCYNDESKYKNTYGALYNYMAMRADIYPRGWGIPSTQDWQDLKTFLDPKSEGIAGAKLKGKGNAYWQEGNLDATDEYHFNAMPGGYYTYLQWSSPEPNFQKSGTMGYWWTGASNAVISLSGLSLIHI